MAASTRSTGPAGQGADRGVVPAVVDAAARPAGDVLANWGATPSGLSGAEATRRLAEYGRNAVRTQHVRVWYLLAAQLRSPLLLLLAATALVSAFVGEGADALIIGVVLVGSVGLGFANEYRAARAAQAMHDQLRHHSTVRRDGHPQWIDVTRLVPGDIVELRAGEVVPADLRLLAATELECDESVLTGESTAVRKSVHPVPPETTLADLTSAALMGTVVRGGSGLGVVVATAGRAEFGRLALELGEREPETQFQIGLRQFSGLLVRVALVLTLVIFVINVALHRPVIDAVLFSLAIAVGISPQLLPAVVSTGLATGSRDLARCKVLVKRLVCIEDLGDIEVLFTDKTGTLTDGRIRFVRALGPDGQPSQEPLVAGLLCNEAVLVGAAAVGGNSLDRALWESPPAAGLAAGVAGWTRLDVDPFEHVTRSTTVLARDPDGRVWVIVKGAPESVLPRCARPLGATGARTLDAEFAAGSRVVAVARGRVQEGVSSLTDVGSEGLDAVGLLIFLDPPKADAAEALARLAALDIAVKVITGDNAVVAERVGHDLGLPAGGTLTGTALDSMSDDDLTAALPTTTVFARVNPEQKARIVRLQRRAGAAVAFIGDGANDAIALHAADVGISVESATDVAKDAADVILLEKSLGVLATGVVEGRRVFANTIKYVLMGTSSNFGNMASAALASAVLGFLPMLPSQILLNNLMYDTSQLAIPTDCVDLDQLRRPSHWDIGMIRRFMLYFGPISSAFDFLTFGLLLFVLDAGVTEFRTGWFVESLATQTLVIFVIRTRQVPFVRSRPSRAMILSCCTVVLSGAWLPTARFADVLGFTPLPWAFYLAIAGLVTTYLVLVDVAKAYFFARIARPAPGWQRGRPRRVARRAARFTHPSPRARRAHRRRRAGPVAVGSTGGHGHG